MYNLELDVSIQEAYVNLETAGPKKCSGEISSGRTPQQLVFTSLCRHPIPLGESGFFFFFFQETYDMLEIIIPLYPVSFAEKGSIIYLKNIGLFIFW